uniref:Vacuolar amino acid transporter YPQ1 n=1 Tax=Physcomitrium patens TaxID=3218 RepID=A0A7I4FUY3_PHYPA
MSSTSWVAIWSQPRALMICLYGTMQLPTQLYMAILYTLTTIILVLQTIYYDRLNALWRRDRVRSVDDLFPETRCSFITICSHPKTCGVKNQLKKDLEAQKPIPISECANEGPESASTPASSQPASIGVPHHHHRATSPGSRDHLYLQSARSLASSHAQPIGSYKLSGSRGSTGRHGHHSYLLTQEDFTETPALAGSHPRRASPVSLSSSTLRTMTSGVLMVGTLGLSLYTTRRVTGGPTIGTTHISHNAHSFGDHFLGEEPSPLGEVFGWIMACIYMGGRLPQIWLNIKRGTVEGLNPLMFAFALLGNATYVGSILVRSMDWQQALKPNLAWLVDAAVCVILDIFILCQFIYYYSKMEDDKSSSEEESWPYKPLN